MSTFTPNPKLDPSTNPRDWAYELACLPISASIVFTKDSFLAFLKTHNIEVSPNYTEINKLPRYAKIGTMSEASSAPAASSAEVSQLADKVAAVDTSSSSSPPPRPQHSSPLAGDGPNAPRSNVAALLTGTTEPVQAAHTDYQRTPAAATAAAKAARPADTPVITPDGQEFRPTRRVREPIGGGSALISALFGDDAGKGGEVDYAAEAALESRRRRGLLQEVQPQAGEQQPAMVQAKQASAAAASTPSDDQEQNSATANVFRPTRRVREPGGTGGSSSIALG